MLRVCLYVSMLSVSMFAADVRPDLLWVRTAGEAGKTSVAAAAADSRGNLYLAGSRGSHVFVLKLDGDGNTVYSTDFGGSGTDRVAALAVGSDGGVFLTGSTTSSDLPVTAGAYLTLFPGANGATVSYVLKLGADGSVAWATYFRGGTTLSIAVDTAGNPLVGGRTSGNLPVTDGAYQTSFQQTMFCTGFIGCFGGPTSAFVTKLNAQGTGLIFSTYLSTDNTGNLVQGAQAMVLDAAGNAWIGVAVDPNLVPAGHGADTSVVELNATGSAVLASTAQPGLGSVAALAIDASGNVYVAGSYWGNGRVFPATPGAFQQAPQPAVPALPYQPPAGGGLDAFVAKFDPTLTQMLAATLLGGELPDAATSITIDAAGRVILSGYTDSRAFPTRTPSQELFSSRSGFLAALDGSLSQLLFSNYMGDGRPFRAQTAVLDPAGNLFVAGNTLSAAPLFIAGDAGAPYTEGDLAVVNKFALAAAPALRIDSVQNYASHLAAPLAPGEPVIVRGTGFSSGAEIVVDGVALPTTGSDASLMAVIPDDAAKDGAHTVQISDAGTTSNAVYVPAAAASPAIYSADGSGAGQAYILNSDGTRNSSSNPAAPGSSITIFIAGAGSYSVQNGFAVADLMPSVYVSGFYCNGIAAVAGPVAGLPGNVYQLSVHLPDLAALIANNPDLKSYRFPAQSAIEVVMGPVNPLNPVSSNMVSQTGVFVSIAQ